MQCYRQNADEYIQMHPPRQRTKKNSKPVYRSQFVQKSTHFNDPIAMLLENIEQLNINYQCVQMFLYSYLRNRLAFLHCFNKQIILIKFFAQ